MTQHPYSSVPPGDHIAQPRAYLQPGFSQPAYPLAPHQRQSTALNANGYLELGKLGAVVGLCGAGATNLRRVQADQVTGGEALFDTLRTGVAAGLATATAGFVANQLRHPAASFLATLVTGTAVMYILNAETTEQAAPGTSPGDQA